MIQPMGLGSPKIFENQIFICEIQKYLCISFAIFVDRTLYVWIAYGLFVDLVLFLLHNKIVKSIWSLSIASQSQGPILRHIHA